MTETGIDITPLELVWGTLTAPGDSLAGAADLQRWLRERRVVAGVRALEEQELNFLVVADGDMVQVIDADARLTAGPTLDQLRAEITAAGLATHVTLSSTDDDELEEGDGAALWDPEAWDGDDPEGSQWPDEPDWVTWRFSAQGEGWAHVAAALSPGPVTSAVWGAWSAVGGIDSFQTGLDLQRSELPSVEVNLPSDGRGRGWLEVRSAHLPRGAAPYFLQAPPATWLTFAPDEVAAPVRDVLQLLSDPETEAGSDRVRILADPSLDVAPQALCLALAPTDEPRSEDLVAAVVALGVPPQLARLLLREEADVARTKVLSGRKGECLLNLLDGGLADLAPRNRELGSAERAGVWLRRHPAAAVALAAAEMTAGGLLALRGGRRAARLGGILLLLDGAVESILAGRRLLRPGRRPAPPEAAR